MAFKKKKHDFLIHTDGICVYVSIGVKTALIGKIYLMVMHAAVLTIIGIALKEWIPAMLIMFLVIEGCLMKYTLWNIFGKERLIINTKSISFQHDYGFFKTDYVTREIHRMLDIRLSETDSKSDRRYLHFLSCNENDIPLEIYSAALTVTEGEGERLAMQVKQLFVDTLTEQYELPPIHMN